jgi:hypothetical protein
MTAIRDVAGKLNLNVAAFELPLKKGLQFVVEPKASTGNTTTSYRLLDWQYRIASQPEGTVDCVANLELTVEEIKPPGFLDSWFARQSDDFQFLFPLIAALIVCAFAGAVGWTLHVNPDSGWAFAGRHVRAVGGWTVFLLFAALFPWKLGLYKGQASFEKNFANSFFVLIAWLMLALWLTFSAWPDGSHADYAAYAKTLARKVSTSYWPLLVAVLPWLSVAFKLLGMDFAENATEGLQKAAVKEK